MLLLDMAYRLLREFRQASTRLDTPPFSNRRHPGSDIAPDERWIGRAPALRVQIDDAVNVPQPEPPPHTANEAACGVAFVLIPRHHPVQVDGRAAVIRHDVITVAVQEAWDVQTRYPDDRAVKLLGVKRCRYDLHDAYAVELVAVVVRRLRSQVPFRAARSRRSSATLAPSNDVARHAAWAAASETTYMTPSAPARPGCMVAAVAMPPPCTAEVC